MNLKSGDHLCILKKSIIFDSQLCFSILSPSLAVGVNKLEIDVVAPGILAEEITDRSSVKNMFTVKWVSNTSDINEDIDSAIAYMLPFETPRPRIDRTKYLWGPHQSGKKGLTSYKCLGHSYICNKCERIYKSEVSTCHSCNGDVLYNKCQASKLIFNCEEKCNRKIWSNECCKTKGKKLIILYTLPHTCSDHLAFVPVLTDTDILKNIKEFCSKESKMYIIEQVSRLPCDINGDSIYLLSKSEANRDIDNLIKDGRRYEKCMKSRNKSFNQIFGKNVEENVRIYKCRGTLYCFNSDCPFLRRFDAVNQVQFDKQTNGEKLCVSCGEPMFNINCDAKKYVVFDEKFVLVKHEGNHECPSRTTYETNIVTEIENYFALNGTSTPFEAVVNHLNQKLNFENAEKEIQELVKYSLKKWTVKNAKAKVKKHQNPHGPTIEVRL